MKKAGRTEPEWERFAGRTGILGEKALGQNKKGAGASPLRQLTPQNRNTVEVVFRPPREANLF